MTAVDKITVCRVVRGDDWEAMDGNQEQEVWNFLRGVFARRAEAAGYQIETSPIETVEVDDATGSLLLRIQSVGTREDSSAA